MGIRRRDAVGPYLSLFSAPSPRPWADENRAHF
jgi:hypothetical protein